MIYWINGPYGVGKSTLADVLHELKPDSFIFDAEEVGNAVRINRPESMFNGYIFEGYRLWFVTIVELLKEITDSYDGDIFIPMTLVYEDSFSKIEKPLKELNIPIKHILLESNYETVHDRIIARGESEESWCMQNIEMCLRNQRSFENVTRIKSTGRSPLELAKEILVEVLSEGR